MSIDEETWPWAEQTWGMIVNDLHTFVYSLGGMSMRTMHQWDPTARLNPYSSFELQRHECFYKLGPQKHCFYLLKTGGDGYLKNHTGRQRQRIVKHPTWLQISTNKAQPGIQRVQWEAFEMSFLSLDEEIRYQGLEQRGWLPFLYMNPPSTQHRIPRHYNSFSPGGLGDMGVQAMWEPLPLSMLVFLVIIQVWG